MHNSYAGIFGQLSYGRLDQSVQRHDADEPGHLRVDCGRMPAGRRRPARGTSRKKSARQMKSGLGVKRSREQRGATKRTFRRHFLLAFLSLPPRTAVIGPKADVVWARRGVRFQGESGHEAAEPSLRLMTLSRHEPVTWVARATHPQRRIRGIGECTGHAARAVPANSTKNSVRQSGRQEEDFSAELRADREPPPAQRGFGPLLERPESQLWCTA